MVWAIRSNRAAGSIVWIRHPLKTGPKWKRAYRIFRWFGGIGVYGDIFTNVADNSTSFRWFTAYLNVAWDWDWTDTQLIIQSLSKLDLVPSGPAAFVGRMLLSSLLTGSSIMERAGVSVGGGSRWDMTGEEGGCWGTAGGLVTWSSFQDGLQDMTSHFVMLHFIQDFWSKHGNTSSFARIKTLNPFSL